MCFTKTTFFSQLPFLPLRSFRARLLALTAPSSAEVRALSDARCRSMSPPLAPEGTWFCALVEASVCSRSTSTRECSKRAARTLV